MKLSLLFYIALLLITAGLTQAEVTVSARFQPSTVLLGDSAQYLVTIKESSTSEMPEVERITTLPVPQIRGLELINGRIATPRRERVSINFKTEYAITQNLVIEAATEKAGDYTIPRFAFTYKGNTYTAPAATLTVIERPADAPPPIDELIFLKVNTPEQLYIGQSANIELKLYIHEKARYRGIDNFQREADSFTVSELPEGTESVERIGNYRYQVITWPLTITPIQSGLSALNFELSVVAEVPQQGNGRGNSTFGSSIFDNFFSRSERFNLFNEPTEIEVLPLPQEGQPKSFSGAIGDFSIQVATDAEDSRVGEPIMLSLKVSGTGNFDRISGPNLPESVDWRSYEPEAHTEFSEAQTLKGVKRFDYVFIPQKAGKRMLPEVAFSFFDPNERSYVELSAPPIPVEVAASQEPQFIAPVAAQDTPAPTAALELTKRLSPEEALLILDYRPTPSASSGFTIIQQPIFYVLNTLALAVIASAAGYLHKRRRLTTDKDYARQHAARLEYKNTLAALNAAQAKGNEATFYQLGQEAVRLAATVHFRENLRAADLHTLKIRLHAKPGNDALIETTTRLFEKADSLRFSGRAATSIDLHAARKQLDTILKAL
jgi:hypothetical protein